MARDWPAAFSALRDERVALQFREDHWRGHLSRVAAALRARDGHPFGGLAYADFLR
jgi:hypothetical protein